MDELLGKIFGVNSHVISWIVIHSSFIWQNCNLKRMKDHFVAFSFNIYLAISLVGCWWIAFAVFRALCQYYHVILGYCIFPTVCGILLKKYSKLTEKSSIPLNQLCRWLIPQRYVASFSWLCNINLADKQVKIVITNIFKREKNIFEKGQKQCNRQK